MMTLKTLKEKINKLNEEKDKLRLKLERIDRQILRLLDEYYEKSPEFVKVTCITCGGTGYIKDKDGKKHLCSNPSIPFLSCNGKGYIWLRKYEE